MNRNGYTALTASERRKEDGFVPYGWHIDIPGDPDGIFIPHNEHKDYAYAMQRAADAHGTIVPVFRERRKFG